MASLLKLVCLGGAAAEVQALIEAQASAFEDAKVEQGFVAGCAVLRLESRVEIDGTKQRFALFALAGRPDFRDVYQRLLSNADGVIGLIPTDLARSSESAKVLGHLQKGLQTRLEEGHELPFLLQYQWAEQAQAPTPEEVDQALQVNPQAVERVFTRVGDSGQENATMALLKKCKTATEVTPENV